MKLLTIFRPRKRPASILSLCLALCLCLALLPPAPVSADPYYQPSVDKLVGWGVLLGYPDGTLEPENPITRAEFVAMVNRSYGYHETGYTPFRDVPAGAWYADDIGIAYNAGYFQGTTATTAEPDANLTREQALVLLARNMRLEPAAGEISQFSDARDFGTWSRGYVDAAYQKGLINGYTDGSFRPTQNITRGEMSALLARALGNLVNVEGTRSLGDVYGNVTLNTPNTTLKDTTIAGDLYVSGGLGLGGVTLDNVRVLGNIIVAGGGEAQAGDSVILRNTQADQLLVDSLAGQYLSLRAEGDTMIDQTSVRSDAYIMDRTQSGSGLLNISLDNGGQFSLAGNLESVINKSAASSLNVAAGALQKLVVDETAQGSSLNIDRNATVRTLTLDTGTSVTGNGDIDQLNVLTAGSTAQMLPDAIDIRPGITATVAGEQMTSSLAQESTAEPRLLAGYPKVSNLAPTSATATFSTNKAGTVYWAVSLVADGSVVEADLITPPTYTTKIVRNGNLRATASNTDYTAAVTGLAAGSNYYLSAVMVDSRGTHSPVKVISFSTPDNTVPNFSGGTPTISQNTSERTGSGSSMQVTYKVQVMVIPTKTCQLHWALYARGSTAPTAAEFRSGNLDGSLAHNVMEVTRNSEEYIRIHNFYTLQELTNYDLYVCLIDGDNAQSSAVRSLPFTTVDGTPPIITAFERDGAVRATSLPLRVTVNENATVYWTAVPTLTGSDYPKPPAGGGRLTEEYAQLQIANGGAGATSNGRVTARANTSVSFNVTGLQPETSYDIWYVAVDSAGNYSVLTIENNKVIGNHITLSTLDTNPPTVTQDFTQPSANSLEPYANTGVQLIFNENIQHNESSDEDISRIRPLDLYNDSQDSSKTETQRQNARSALTKLLRDSIKLYDVTTNNARQVAERTSDTDENWIIDYRNARVALDDGKLIITFPHTDTDAVNHDSALNLRSGSGYRFQIQNIEDVSDNQNPMPRTDLPIFRTIAAQVAIEPLSLTRLDDKVAVASDQGTEIDLAFTLTPVSTNVENSILWDLLLFSDTSVTFDLYYRWPTDSGTSNWVKVEPAGASTPSRHTYGSLPFETSGAIAQADFTTTETDPDYNNIIINPEMTAGFYGKSFFRDFCGYTANPSVRRTLVDERQYDFAIHITSVNGVAERFDGSSRIYTWDQEVTFEVAAVTSANSGDLYNLTQRIKTNTYESLLGEQGSFRTAGTVAEIDIPNPYERSKIFTDSTSPDFVEGYPTFSATDSSVTMDLMLTHAGRVWYVIAPLRDDGRPRIDTTTAESKMELSGTTYTVKSGTTVTSDNMDKLPDADGSAVDYLGVPYSGVPSVMVTNPSTSDLRETEQNRLITAGGVSILPANFVPLQLLSPTPANIYNPSGYRGISQIKTGSVAVNDASISVTETGLQKSTTYFVYLVTQGSGTVYSRRVQLYRFKTPDVTRPHLEIGWNNAITRLTSTDMDAVADSALFQQDTLPLELSRPFSAAVDSDVWSGAYANYLAANTTTTNATAYKSSDFTVYQAMSVSLRNGDETLFNLFATERYKNSVASIIRATSGVTGLYSYDRNQTLTRGEEHQVNWATAANGRTAIEPAVNYLFVAVARSSNANADASGDSLSFISTYPVRQQDTKIPDLVSLTGDVSINADSDGNYIIDGEVTLTFDRDLWIRSGTTRRRVTMNTGAANHTDDYRLADDTNVTHVSKLIGSVSSGQSSKVYVVTPDTALPAAGTAVRNFTLRLDEILSGTRITLNGGLSGEMSDVRNVPLTLTLTYNPSTMQVEGDVAPAVWYPTPYTYINTRGVVATTGISLDSATLSISVNGERTLKPTLRPTNATDQTVVWTVSDSSVVSLSSYITEGSETVTVYGEGAGTATVTATASGGQTATCRVTVSNIAVTGISLSGAARTYPLSVNGTGQVIRWNIAPAAATNQAVTLRILNAAVSGSPTENQTELSFGPISYSDGGGYVEVTANETGTWTMEIRTVDGGYSTYVSFSVT